MRRIVYLLLVSISVLSFYGCSSDRDNINSNIFSNIDLSLFGVHMGESLDSLMNHLPKLKKVPFDSINYAKYDLPYYTDDIQIFEDLEITVYCADTVFVVGFPWSNKKTLHHAKLCYLVKNSKVLQGEVLITNPVISYANIALSVSDFVNGVKEMYYDRYHRPDSILMYNRVTNRAAFVGYREDKKIRNQIYDQLRGNHYHEDMHEEDVWVWKNAKIYADYDYKPCKKGGPHFWAMCRVLRIRYIDMEAINCEKEIILRERDKEKQDSLKRIQQEHIENIKRYNSQDF